MKRFLYFILCVSFYSAASAQRYTDFGVIAGGASYHGQINPTQVFYRPQMAFGGFFRYNIDKRHAVRLSGYYLGLQGSDSDFSGRVLTDRSSSDFALRLMDCSAQFEFNFLPYISGDDAGLYSLYVASGVGYSLVLSGSSTFNLPFGTGVKFNLTERMSVGAEWSFRKTFTDNLDGVESQLERSAINNNDWYYSAGLFISYKFVKFAADCPVYD